LKSLPGDLLLGQTPSTYVRRLLPLLCREGAEPGAAAAHGATEGQSGVTMAFPLLPDHDDGGDDELAPWWVITLVMGVPWHTGRRVASDHYCAAVGPIAHADDNDGRLL